MVQPYDTAPTITLAEDDASGASESANESTEEEEDVLPTVTAVAETETEAGGTSKLDMDTEEEESTSTTSISSTINSLVVDAEAEDVVEAEAEVEAQQNPSASTASVTVTSKAASTNSNGTDTNANAGTTTNDTTTVPSASTASSRRTVTVLHHGHTPAIVLQQVPLPTVPAASVSATASATCSNTTKTQSLESSQQLTSNQQHNQDRAQAIAHARNLLLMEVPALPILLNSSSATAECLIESFGEVQTYNNNNNASSTSQSNRRRSRYCKPSAIYPIGFQCVRYEYSPLHGRMIALRCSVRSGPVFVISFGDVNEIDRNNINENNGNMNVNAGLRSFDPYPDVQAPAVYHRDNYERDDSATVTASSTVKWDALGNTIPPQVNYAAKVRFDNDWWYAGYVSDVNTKPNANDLNAVDTLSTSASSWLISITFDDGAVEDDIEYPSPDVLLFHPCTEEVNSTDTTTTTTTQQKKVTVTGSTPLEAWSACLTYLGLIDEEIMRDAMHTLTNVRDQGLSEAKQRYTAAREQRKVARSRKQSHEGGTNKSNIINDSVAPNGGIITDEEDNMTEVATAEEEELLEAYTSMLDEHALLLADSKDMNDILCNTRASQNVAPFCNTPFSKVNSTVAQQEQWLAAVVKREKMRMGHTGNKRKIVSCCDLLERLDTFYPCEDVERLIEGLPGTDQCPSYVFKACRGTGSHAASQAWVYEAQLRAEREMNKEQNKSSHTNKSKYSKKEKESKNNNIAQISKIEQKRKLREQALAIKKQQKLDEEESKRNERKLKRMRQLDTQVNERMLKEAMYQREKVVRGLLKSQERERARRVKGVEGVGGYKVEQGLIKQDSSLTVIGSCVKEHQDNDDMLLPERYCQVFDRDVIRLWDFLQSYRLAFEDSAVTLPSLDQLQESIMNLKHRDNSKCSGNSKDLDESINTLINLALILCQPLTTNLTKMLTLSVTAANVGYSYVPDYSIQTLPVNAYTWREIARLAFVGDALVETGFSKVDSAHILRGYRSGGHPNSKEAKRLRRGEDFALLQLRQALVESANTPSSTRNPRISTGNELKVRVSVPCQPSCGPDDWIYFLHNIKALSSSDEGMGSNIKQALQCLKDRGDKNEGLAAEDWQAFEADLERCVPMLKSKADRSKARTISLRVLERFLKKTGVLYKPPNLTSSDSDISSTRKSTKKKPRITYQQKFTAITITKPGILTEKEYSKLVSARENYMADAVKLKEAMERKKLRNEGEDVDDDDDDDDDGMFIDVFHVHVLCIISCF